MQADAQPAGQSAGLPGDSGVWIFIIADMGAFALFFLLFTVGRVGDPALYEESRQHLNATLGLLNTLILLTSSLFMVRAVEAARREDRGGVSRNLALTMLIGSGFAVCKFIEYAAKTEAGITLTGIHFLHFIVGIGALLMMFAKSRREALDARFVTWIESVGCYWHMVDLLWIMLFPMLYLLRAA
jgi:nitric oxide reductase NorE protein